MRRPSKNWLALRMLASRGAGMWAALMLALLSLLMIVNNFHMISFHFRQSSFAFRDVDGLHIFETMQSRWVEYNNSSGLEFSDSSEVEVQRVGVQRAFRSPSRPGLLVNGTAQPTTPVRRSNSHQGINLNRTWAAPVLYPDPELPAHHPCQGFTFPPPPADKKRTGPRPCPVCYLPVEKAIKAMPASGMSPTPKLKHLTYTVEPEIEDVLSTDSGSEFGGHPTLDDRSQSYQIQEDMRVHCGFVKGSEPGVGTGFDISPEDRAEMLKCGGVVVGSAIFGNYDELQQPKNISQEARNNVCFFMFIDEETGKALLNSADLRSTRKIGLWRLVVVSNLPYSDPRRTGKIPKLLIHRLFPNARFSLWVDGKLELVVDPYQILERFLWRTNHTFAISRHYARFDVFVEAEANKAAGKYDNGSIEAQVDFYRSEGMTPYTSSKLPITSDVPEGCVIIREHNPITNLFGCLWFNEVDRFTSRDQLSFGIVRDKIMSQVPWRVNMFLDCERRNFVVQGYHRDVLEQKALLGQRLSANPERDSRSHANQNRSDSRSL